MSNLQAFQVYPKVPAPLSFLEVLTRNLWWCWNLDAIELFRRVSPRLWVQAGRNPIIFSTLVPQKKLEELAQDESILAHLEEIKEKFERDVLKPIDYSDTPFGRDGKIAYFSMEFGIHESLPIFAGGLGILAGDHLKAASDIALPLVGVGLLYHGGYFNQYLNQDGWQQEAYPPTDIFHLPIRRCKTPTHQYMEITIKTTQEDIKAAVWELNVGRVTLFLLDTNLPENPPHIREVTSRLYAGEGRIRLAQEILLGIGGMKALEAAGISPVVCHMNEGHCAFAGLERLIQTMSQQNVDLDTAFEIVARSTVFTTHTPVAAGHDEFSVDMIKPYLQPIAEKLNLPVETVIAWGQPDGAAPDSPFCMFILGLRMAQFCNGVSELHGKVARRMWSHVWPRMPEDEIPITHVTNGIHIPSWISIENSMLFDRYMGPDWRVKTQSKGTVARIQDIYDEELWRAHEMSRSRLIRHCRRLMVKQYNRRNASKRLMKEAESVLDQDILTIAFARRFATYKRAYLLLQDPERLEALLNAKDHPVQIIFAGKAHPKDDGGKELIQRIFQFAQNKNVGHRLIFLEDYNPDIARHLVQGADVWLNTPRRPYEACGTSGMKAAVNGVLNVSIPDGWWCEGYSPECGWQIGNGEEYNDLNYQDSVESQALYNVLENDVIPCFYDRQAGSFPSQWIKRMKASMQMAISGFGSIRMANDYNERFYKRAATQRLSLLGNGAAEAKRLNQWHKRLLENWPEIRISQPRIAESGPFRVGETVKVSVEVTLGQLSPDEVEIQLYYGHLQSVEVITSGQSVQMQVKEDLGEGRYAYECRLDCRNAGRFGFTVRAQPSGDELIQNAPGLITWA